MEKLNIIDMTLEKDIKIKYEDNDSIFITSSDDRNKVIKLFKSDDDYILEQKEMKIEALRNLKIGHEQPIDMLYLNEKFKGYTFYNPYDKRNSFKQLNIFDKKKRKIENLKAIRNKLELLHDNGIVVGDFDLDKILVDDYGFVIFLNIDSSKIENKYECYDFDHLEKDAKRYLDILNIDSKEADKHLDYYLFNIATVEYLEKIYKTSSFDYIVNPNIKLPTIINNNENRKTTLEMINLEDSKEIKPYIDKVKRYHLF